MDNPKSVGERAAGSTVDRSKKRNQDHAEGSKKVGNRPLKKCKTKKRIQKSKNKIDEDEKFRDQKNEIIELSRSIKELTEAVKSLPEILLTILKDRKTTPEINDEEERHSGCCHLHIQKMQLERFRNQIQNVCVDCQDVGYHDERTILVLRLDELHLPRDQVKIMLRGLFGSCGEIKTLSVPIDYKTGFPVGFAFIDLKDGQGYEKALKLDHYELEGVQLDVTLAENLSVSEMYRGCERCMSDTFARRKPGFDLDQDHPELYQDPDPQALPASCIRPYRVYC